MQRNHLWGTSDLIGMPVRSLAGESLGKIDDLIVDPSTGRTPFAVLSFGGLLGMGDKLVAVPWGAFSQVPGGDYLLLDMDKNVLQRAPSFDSAHRPDFGDPAWRSGLYRHYGYPEHVAAQERPAVVHHEYHPRGGMSAVTALLSILLLVGLLGVAYLITTRGWDQTRNDMAASLEGVTHAMKETSGDAALTAKVKTSLSLNRRIPSGNINVDSKDGIVTLRGDVPSDEIRALSETIAQDVPGVREVRNHLYVMSPGN